MSLRRVVLFLGGCCLCQPLRFHNEAKWTLILPLVMIPLAVFIPLAMTPTHVSRLAERGLVEAAGR